MSKKSNSNSYDYAVYIGRFQPFHNGHLSACQQALFQSNHLIILVGSAFSAPNIRNPFSWEQRREMISTALNEAGLQNKFTIMPVRDYFYSDNAWIQNVQKVVGTVVASSNKVALIGHKKDYTSYYLDLFPKWDRIDIDSSEIINATDIREYFFGPELFDDHFSLPKSVADYLRKFQLTEQSRSLQEEYRAMEEYKDAWSKAPYAPVFVTADAVVTCGGHVLLVKRKGQPGKGQFALPGGFIKGTERIVDSCIRELKEETKIKVPIPVLKGSIKNPGGTVFDHPLRSVRGRTVTHAFYIELQDKELPKIKAADDAEKVMWVPLNEIVNMWDQIFEDHAVILESFIGRML